MSDLNLVLNQILGREPTEKELQTIDKFIKVYNDTTESLYKTHKEDYYLGHSNGVLVTVNYQYVIQKIDDDRALNLDKGQLFKAISDAHDRACGQVTLAYKEYVRQSNEQAHKLVKDVSESLCLTESTPFDIRGLN